MLSESKDDYKKHDLKIGKSITFDGSKTYNGVMPVTEGIRIALNIWMTNTNSKFLDITNEKKLI